MEVIDTHKDLRNILKSSATLQVHAHWEPIADSTFNMHKDSPVLTELFDLSPNQPVKEYRADVFNAFLPPSTVAVGDVWELNPNGLITFLHQFHKGASTAVYHGAEGAFACLQAFSPDYAEVAFRIHADFTLESAAYKAWQDENSSEDDDNKSRFVPSHFVGRLVLNLKKGTVRAFSLHLRPRNSNVIISAFGGIDMVFVPRMELLTTDETDQNGIAWDAAITMEEAHRALELKFYKFSEINWLPIDAAVTQAKATNRPIHAILVWGCLDDESC